MDKRFVDPSIPANDAAELLLRIAAVVRVTGLGRSTIYRLVAHDQFSVARSTHTEGCRLAARRRGTMDKRARCRHALSGGQAHAPR